MEMNKQIEAQEVPLIELLKRIPENARLIVDSGDGMSSSYHPVGYLCHKAAQALAEAEKQEPVAIVMEDSYGYGASLYKRLPLGTKLYTNPAKWQSLSDDEIFQLSIRDFTKYEFARAIEQALKEKNT
jgi:hypothetical protein